VNDLTLDEIKGFSAEKGEKIPTLKEALAFLDKKVKHMQQELTKIESELTKRPGKSGKAMKPPEYFG
jgi:viroplasmin and RNaseH domain-containing protein